MFFLTGRSLLEFYQITVSVPPSSVIKVQDNLLWAAFAYSSWSCGFSPWLYQGYIIHSFWLTILCGLSCVWFWCLSLSLWSVVTVFVICRSSSDDISATYKSTKLYIFGHSSTFDSLVKTYFNISSLSYVGHGRPNNLIKSPKMIHSNKHIGWCRCFLYN